jgi:hypothetical protein
MALHAENVDQQQWRGYRSEFMYKVIYWNWFIGIIITFHIERRVLYVWWTTPVRLPLDYSLKMSVYVTSSDSKSTHLIGLTCLQMLIFFTPEVHLMVTINWIWYFLPLRSIWWWSPSIGLQQLSTNLKCLYFLLYFVDVCKKDREFHFWL